MPLLKFVRTAKSLVSRRSSFYNYDIRPFSHSLIRFSVDDHEYPLPVIVGPGAKPRTIPTALEQSTGLERLEVLGNIEGRNIFDMNTINLTHMGTPKNPVIVYSVDENRYVGCTGYPSDTHELIWINVQESKGVDRCPECGCCYRVAPYVYPEIGKVVEQ